MDDLDMRILREIGTEPFHAGPRGPHPWRPEALAKRLGESPRLVKDRVARLERSVVATYDVMPDPSTLGLALRTYALRSPSAASKEGAAQRLRAIDGVIAWVDFLSGWSNVAIMYADDAELQERLGRVKAALHGAVPEAYFVPPPDRLKPEALTRTDWRIVRALRGDAKKPVSALAAELGVTTKTVQRRLEKMHGSGAIDTFARLDARAFEEVLFATLKLRLNMPEAMQGMQVLHGETLANAWALCSAELLIGDAHYDLVVAPRSAKGLRELVEKASKLPGVIEVEGHVATELEWVPGWLDRQIDGKIAELAA